MAECKDLLKDVIADIVARTAKELSPLLVSATKPALECVAHQTAEQALLTFEQCLGESLEGAGCKPNESKP